MVADRVAPRGEKEPTKYAFHLAEPGHHHFRELVRGRSASALAHSGARSSGGSFTQEGRDSGIMKERGVAWLPFINATDVASRLRELLVSEKETISPFQDSFRRAAPATAVFDVNRPRILHCDLSARPQTPIATVRRSIRRSSVQDAATMSVLSRFNRRDACVCTYGTQ